MKIVHAKFLHYYVVTRITIETSSLLLIITFCKYFSIEKGSN